GRPSRTGACNPGARQWPGAEPRRDARPRPPARAPAETRSARGQPFRAAGESRVDTAVTEPLMSYSFEPIGVVRSCFAEKFAIPRQPRLAPAATGVLELFPPYDRPEAITGLEQVSHLWLLFVFHAAASGPEHIRVRPPRLGGNQRIGVFASCATHRPNPLGQSVVRLDGIEAGRLHVSGIDLLDGTPLLDIKPYVPYADSVCEATNDLAPAPPVLLPVSWSSAALDQARMHAGRLQQPVLEL